MDSIGKFFSAANEDILADQAEFPVLWLSDLQNAQLLFASRPPAGTLVNGNGGAPNPAQVDYNYLLAELYVGLGPTGSDSNNGDITYIEQFGLPASLNVWYTDGDGSLYRGIVDQNGSGLSIPGTSSFLLNGATNPGVNDASAFAQTLEEGYPQLQQTQLGETDGELYANPKTLYSGVPNAIVNPEYGDFYDYFKYLKGLDPATYPIRWSGQFNQQQAYRVTDVTFTGFAGTGEFAGYDQNSSIQLSINYDSYASGGPPSHLTQTADVVIPWFGVPQTPSLPGITPVANAYAVTNSDTAPQQPSGGWTLEWSSDYQNSRTFSGSNGVSVLNPFQGSTPQQLTGGSGAEYQVTGLYSYYDELFSYDSNGITLTPRSYDWNPSGDPLLSVSEMPTTSFGWQSLTLDGDPTAAVLQIQYENGQLSFQGASGQLWNDITAGSEFKVPDGGLLPGNFSPTVKLLEAPNSVTGVEDLTFQAVSGISTAAPITSFAVLDPSNNNAKVATLTLSDTWQANQLVNPANFTYAATTAGILGAGAGYYYRSGTTGNYTTELALQNDLYGTVVGDFLSLINAGLLGATTPFAYEATGFADR